MTPATAPMLPAYMLSHVWMIVAAIGQVADGQQLSLGLMFGFDGPLPALPCTLVLASVACASTRSGSMRRILVGQ